MMTLLKTFYAQEDGVVTVDWIVIGAAGLLLTVSGISMAQSSLDTMSEFVSSDIASQTVSADGN